MDGDDGYGDRNRDVSMTMGWLSDPVAAPASDSDTPGTLGPETQVSLSHSRPNPCRSTLCSLETDPFLSTYYYSC